MEPSRAATAREGNVSGPKVPCGDASPYLTTWHIVHDDCAHTDESQGTDGAIFPDEDTGAQVGGRPHLYTTAKAYPGCDRGEIPHDHVMGQRNLRHDRNMRPNVNRRRKGYMRQ